MPPSHSATSTEKLPTVFTIHGGRFTAAIPIYPRLDQSVGREVKATQRRYKPALSPNRNSTRDLLLHIGNVFEWSYIPVGQNLCDPMVSPIFARREDPPPHIFMIACELDLSSHDAWRMACQLAGRPVPAVDDRSGRDECGEVGVLELEDERFAWHDKEKKVRWLLVPDVVHSFDRLTPSMLGDEATVRDARLKLSW
jgi:acetyl esterase/lipase